VTAEDEDAALIDRLYGDAEGEDLEGLRALRGLIARVRDEQPGVEPPQAISAQLLLAAQEHAPRSTVPEEEGPGLWARVRRWFLPIAMHPGLAAAATLVIVVGATAIWMSRGGEIAEPTRRDRAEAAAPAAAPTAPQTGTAASPSAPAPPPATTVETAPPPSDHAAEPPTAATAKPEPPRESTRKATRRAPAKKAKPAAELDGELATAGGAIEPSNAGAADTTGAAAPAGVRGRVGGAAEKAPSQAPAPAPAPAPAAPPPPPAADKAEEPAPRTEAPTESKPVSATDRAKQLTVQAREAAKRGDCQRVATLGAQVKKLDASYYAKTFVTDPAIAACRPPPAD